MQYSLQTFKYFYLQLTYLLNIFFSSPELKAHVSFSNCLLSIVHLSVCQSVHLSVCLSVCPSACLSIHLYLFVYISVCLFVYLSISVSVSLSLSVYPLCMSQLSYIGTSYNNLAAIHTVLLFNIFF